MQRWIALGVVGMLMLIVGAGLALYGYKQNRPSPVWIPLPINPQMSLTNRDEMIQNLKRKLSDPKLLESVSRDVGLTQKWHLASDEEGAREIGKRLFVELGEVVTTAGRGPSINIGVHGKRKERVVLGQLAMRLMDDVCKALGVKPPPHKEDRL